MKSLGYNDTLDTRGVARQRHSKQSTQQGDAFHIFIQQIRHSAFCLKLGASRLSSLLIRYERINKRYLRVGVWFHTFDLKETLE